MESTEHLDHALARQIRHVEREYVRKIRQEAWLAFGQITFGCLFIGSLLLIFVDLGNVFRNGVILSGLGGIAYAFWRHLWLTYRKRPDTEQIALLIDEMYPELENRIISMVTEGQKRRGEQNSYLVRRFLRESQTFVRSSAFIYEPSRLAIKDRRGWYALSLAVLNLLLFVTLMGLWVPRFDFSGNTVTEEFTVEPGNARVQPGDDQTIFVRSHIGPQSVTLMWREVGNRWEETGMRLGDSDDVYYFTLANIQTEIEYRIIFGALESQLFRLTPWLAPEVEELNLTYHFPKYVNQPALEVPHGGDINGLEGTRVQLDAFSNKPLKSLSMVLEEGEPIDFERVAEKHWRGSIILKEANGYHLNPIDEEDGEALFAPDYKISVQKDRAPRIRVSFPFRDLEVSALEEVGFDFEVDDDFGLADYGIRYQVADGEPIDVSLKKKGERELKAEGYHELMLEKLALEPGDVLTWSVWARDQKPGREEFEGMGDPFFLEVRPFKRFFREAISDAGGGQGGAGGGDLVTKQKEVLIATWNLRKEAPKLTKNDFDEKKGVITDTQRGLIEAANAQLGQSAGGKPEFKQLIEAMEESVSQLGAASHSSYASLTEAAAAQQRAYRLLLRLKPEETQVSQQRQQGSGQGQQNAAMNDLEMKRNRNFYEDEKRTRQEQEAAAETLDKIKDLAQRQKMINDEIAKLISEREQKTMDEEEIRRRLERLQEEARKNMQELDKVRREMSQSEMNQEVAEDAKQQLDETRQEMSRSLESLEPDNLQQARSAGSQALKNLDQLEDNLEEQTSQNAEERMAGLQNKMDDLVQRQEDIQQQIKDLANTKDSPKLTADDPKQTAKQKLLDEKEALADDFRELMEDAASVSSMTQGDNDHLSRKLGDWLRETSRQGIGEEMEETSELARLGVWDDLERKEAGIADDLKKAAENLERVASQAGGDELAQAQQALEALEELQRMAGGPGEESEREGERGERGERGQRGERGERGKRGEGEPGEGEGRGEASTDANGRPSQQQKGITPGRGMGSPDMEQQMEQMEEFASEDYREWLEGLRDAEGLLGNSGHTRDLLRMRREIEKMRRNYKRGNLTPKYSDFQNLVLNPLNKTIADLLREVQALREDRRFVLRDDGDIPEKYRKDVATYFRVLSETEGN